MKVIKKSEKLNDEINYYWIGHTKQFGLTRVCTDTLENAIEYARRSQPNYRPFYIIKAVTHFEIIGIVNKRGKFQSRPERENESVGCDGCKYDWFGDPRCSKCARSFQDYYEAVDDVE